MKLRIAERIHPRRKENVYVVQRRQVGISMEGFWMWVDMWYDSHNKHLKLEQQLGEGLVIPAVFNDWHEAKRLAEAYLRDDQPKILQTWRVI